MRLSLVEATGGRGPRILGAIGVACAFLLGSGCHLIGASSRPGGPTSASPESGQAPPDGVYQGTIELDGGTMNAALELRADGGHSVQAVLQLSTEWVAEGDGSLRGTTIDITMNYGGECPGRMRLRGSWSTPNARLTGTVEASDCTGEARGRFSFAPPNR